MAGPRDRVLGSATTERRELGARQLADADAGGLQPIEVPVVWVGQDDLPVVSVNQFLGQVEPGVAFVTVGQVTPPMLGGGPDEQLAQLQRIPFVPIRTVVRLALSRQRLQELIEVLQGTLTNMDSIPSEGGP